MALKIIIKELPKHCKCKNAHAKLIAEIVKYVISVI